MMEENKRPEQEANEERFSAFDQPVYRETSAKKSKVSKRTRTLILSSVGAALLAVVVLIVTLLPSPTAGSSNTPGNTEVSDTTITLLDKTLSDKNAVAVKSATITFEGKTYTVTYHEKDKAYRLKGYEDLSLEPDGVTAITDCLSLIQVSEKVAQSDNLADVGLDKPTAKVTATYHDNSTATLLIGSETPTGGRYYVSLENGDGVYIASADSVSPFLTAAEAYVETTLITAPEIKQDDTTGSAGIREITYSGRTHPIPLTVRRRVNADGDEMTYYTYVITKPYLRGVSDEASNKLVTFNSLEASQAVVLHPSEQELKKYGFQNPLTVMDMTLSVVTTIKDEKAEGEDIIEFYNSATAKLTIGDKDESGNYLVMLDGVDAIFLVASGSLSMVAERNYDNTVTDLLFLKDITEVGKIEITVGSQKHVFDMKHNPKEEDRDKKLTVTVGGNVYSTEEFRDLYQLMMGIDRYDGLKKAPTIASDLSITLYDVDGSLYLSADFYPESGSLYCVRTTEGELFKTKASGITHFIKQVDHFLNGKDVLTTI